MNKLRIPQNHSGVSKTLRLPENIVDDVQNLANLKNLSFNRIVISLLEFGLSNLDERDCKFNFLPYPQHFLYVAGMLYSFLYTLSFYRLFLATF